MKQFYACLRCSFTFNDVILRLSLVLEALISIIAYKPYYRRLLDFFRIWCEQSPISGITLPKQGVSFRLCQPCLIKMLLRAKFYFL